MAQWIASWSSDLAVRDYFLGGENINLLFNGFEGSYGEKWVGNRRKRFYREMQGNIVLGRRVGKTPVGLSMYDSPMETVGYIWMNVWCMLDWIIRLCHTVDHSGIQLINWWGVHKRRHCCGWQEWTVWKFEPIARLNIWWHNMVKQGFIFSKYVPTTCDENAVKFELKLSNKNWTQN